LPEAARRRLPLVALSLSQKVASLFAAACGAATLIGFLGYRATDRTAAAAELVSHTHRVHTMLEHLAFAITDAETGEDMYLLTNDRTMLDPYYQALPETEKTLGRLRAEIVDNPVQIARLNELQPLVDSILGTFTRRVSARSSSSPAPAVSARTLADDQVLVNDVRRRINEMRSAEESLLVTRSVIARHDANISRTLIILRSALAVLFAAAAAFQILRGLSARAVMEAAVRQTKNQLREVLDHSGDLLHTTTPDGSINYVNRTWLTMLGYDDNEAIGAPIERMIAPERRGDFATAMTAALAGESPRAVDTILLAKDGRRLVVSGTIICRGEDNGVIGTQGAFHDVTEQRRAEEAQRRLVATLEATPDFVGIGTVDGETIYVNHAARRLVGLDDHTDLAAVALADLYAPHARDELTRVAVPAAVRDGSWTGDSVLLRADGQEIPVSQVIVAHPSAQGGIWFVSTIMRDISGWKRLDRMKSEFVSTVSHELRTPLTSIRGALGLIEAGATGPVSRQGRDLVRIARGNTERLIRLVNDMLDLDKIEAGVLELRIANLSIADVIHSTIDGIQTMAGEQGVRLDGCALSTRVIRADRDRVIQVLTNLVSNAIKFSPAQSTVMITATDAPLGVRFQVRNDGAGIAAEDIPRLFHRFQQLDGSDRRRHGGTGLGLAISKAIVQEHGGTIGVESQPLGATTFWFELPAAV
jgi:PAS domain S-box-containing protein